MKLVNSNYCLKDIEDFAKMNYEIIKVFILATCIIYFIHSRMQVSEFAQIFIICF